MSKTPLKQRKQKKPRENSDDEEAIVIPTKIQKSKKKCKDQEDCEPKKPIKKKATKKKDNKILEIKTTQTGAFKQVIERISNVISDCCIVFIPPDNTPQYPVDDDFYEEVDETHPKPSKKNENSKKSKKQANTKNTGGMRILRLTEDKGILIKLNLDASNFESFRCEEPKLTIGVDMNYLHGLLKLISDDDQLIMYMTRDNRSSLYIRSSNESNESNSEETDIEVYLMDIANPDIPIPKTEFQNKITMASDKFHTICKNLNNSSQSVEITSCNNLISFRGKSDGGKVTKTYKDDNDNNKKKDKPDQIVQGIFELRTLMGFSKCNKLCNTLDIYLKNEFPLVLVISVATLGKMYVFLTPIEKPNS